jgi:hypothetical protein
VSQEPSAPISTISNTPSEKRPNNPVVLLFSAHAHLYPPEFQIQQDIKSRKTRPEDDLVLGNQGSHGLASSPLVKLFLVTNSFVDLESPDMGRSIFFGC